MISSSTYLNSQFYYDIMRCFLEGKIKALDFQTKYWRQRHEDIKNEKERGYTYEYYKNKIKGLAGNEKIFKEGVRNRLYESAWSPDCLEVLEEYEKVAQELDIKGELFFMGIWSFIDEYVRVYYPKDDEDFEPDEDIDEEELREKIQAAYDVLERNRERWLNIESEK